MLGEFRRRKAALFTALVSPAAWGRASPKLVSSMRVASRLRVLRRLNVTLMRHSITHFVVQLLIFGSERRKPVHIAVVHTKRRRDKNGIVNLEICGAFLSRFFNVFG